MKKIMKKLLLVMAVTLALVGCKKQDNEQVKNDSINTDIAGQELTGEGLQFEEPSKGETVAEIVVKEYGSIFIKLFPDKAPKAVENFLTHAENGYYNGLIFHRVISDFMIQGGDPTGTGAGGESIWNKAFEDEFSDELQPYRGSLCMANAGPKTNGSQFFIVQAKAIDADSLDSYLKSQGITLTKEARENYINIGGTPWLHNAHTVFGQMYAGYDVLDKIAATETASGDRPTKDIIIEKINVVKY